MGVGTIAGIAIGGATLILVIISLIWGAGLWRYREKVKIRVTRFDYEITREREFQIYLDMEFCRSGGRNIRYVSQVFIKPDHETFSQLVQYFELPADGLIKSDIKPDMRIELPGDKSIVPCINIPIPIYRKSTLEPIPRSVVTPIASQLKERCYKVGLIWEDTSNVMWKEISTDDFAKWV